MSMFILHSILRITLTKNSSVFFMFGFVLVLHCVPQCA